MRHALTGIAAQGPAGPSTGPQRPGDTTDRESSATQDVASGWLETGVQARGVSIRARYSLNLFVCDRTRRSSVHRRGTLPDVMRQGCRFESMQCNQPVLQFDPGQFGVRQPVRDVDVDAASVNEPRGRKFTERGLSGPHIATQSEVTDDSFCIEGNWGGFAVLHWHWVGLKLLRAP
jgi:hypothetical protein